MEIKNIEGLSGSEVRAYVSQGGRFVIYTYCISIVVMTFKRPSSIYFIKPGESKLKHGIGFLICSLFLGWWGIPWGPIYTLGSIFGVLTGGKDVTEEVLTHINQNDPGYGNSGYNFGGSGTSSSVDSGVGAYNIPR